MKKFIIPIILLLGCGHQSEEAKKHDRIVSTRRSFCQEESCPAYVKIHRSYTILTTAYRPDEQDCRCELMSDNSPDSFYVFIPIDAPADSPTY